MEMLQNRNYTYSSTRTNDSPKFVSIAPLPAKMEIENNLPNKYIYKGNNLGAQAASIARRNARERNRVKQVNDGFNALRKRLPTAVINALSGGARRGSGKKLSKVDTLRMVVEYIRHLESLIDESDAALGISKDTSFTDKSYEVDEGIFNGRTSPYSDSVPSPTHSESSSGISCYSNSEYYSNMYYTNDIKPVADNELLDAISWWQQK